MEKNELEIMNLQKKLDDAQKKSDDARRFADIQSKEVVEKIIEYCELGWIPSTPQRLDVLSDLTKYLIANRIIWPNIVYRLELLISQKQSPPDWDNPENVKDILNTIRDELIKQPPKSWHYGSADVDAYARGDLATQALGILFLLSIGEKEYVPLLWKEIVTSLTRDSAGIGVEETNKLLKIAEGKNLPPAVREMLQNTAMAKGSVTLNTTRGYCSALISLAVLALLHYKIPDPMAMQKNQSYREVLQAMVTAMQVFIESEGTPKYTPLMTHELAIMLISLYAIHKHCQMSRLVPRSFIDLALARLQPALTPDTLRIGYRTAPDSAQIETRKGSLGRAVPVNLARVLLSQNNIVENCKRMDDLLQTLKFYSENICYLEISVKRGGYHDGQNDRIAPYYYYATLPFAVSAICCLSSSHKETKKILGQTLYRSLNSVIDPQPTAHAVDKFKTPFPFIGEGGRGNYVYTNIMSGLALNLLAYANERPEYFLLLGVTPNSQR